MSTAKKQGALRGEQGARGWTIDASYFDERLSCASGAVRREWTACINAQR
jgi:hypothetical protein